MNSYNSLREVKLVKKVRLWNPADKCSSSVSAQQLTSAAPNRQQQQNLAIVRYCCSDCCIWPATVWNRNTKCRVNSRCSRFHIYMKMCRLIIHQAAAWSAGWTFSFRCSVSFCFVRWQTLCNNNKGQLSQWWNHRFHIHRWAAAAHCSDTGEMPGG